MRTVCFLVALAPAYALGPSEKPSAAPEASPTKEMPFIPVYPEDVQQILNSGVGITLVDVRSPMQFEDEHIAGAINVPLSTIEGGDDIPLKPDDYIILYCSCPRGGIAAKSARILAQRGYENLWVMLGGIRAWTGVMERAQ